jgi:hypothetical protein
MQKKVLKSLFPRDNQFNICRVFNQNVQYPHATLVTHWPWDFFAQMWYFLQIDISMTIHIQGGAKYLKWFVFKKKMKGIY